jgi:hypothetical protein
VLGTLSRNSQALITPPTRPASTADQAGQHRRPGRPAPPTRPASTAGISQYSPPPAVSSKVSPAIPVSTAVTMLGEAEPMYRATLLSESWPARRSRTSSAAPDTAASTSRSTATPRRGWGATSRRRQEQRQRLRGPRPQADGPFQRRALDGQGHEQQPGQRAGQPRDRDRDRDRDREVMPQLGRVIHPASARGVPAPCRPACQNRAAGPAGMPRRSLTVTLPGARMWHNSWCKADGRQRCLAARGGTGVRETP